MYVRHTIKAHEHHQRNTDWLATCYHFSFADYFDPKKITSEGGLSIRSEKPVDFILIDPPEKCALKN